MKKTIHIKQLLLDAFVILIGNALCAMGLSMFTVPNDIAPGGLSGLATAISHLSNLPVGALTLILNIPLIIIALIKLGRRFLIRTIISTVMLSVFIDLAAFLLPSYTNDVLLSSLIGGVAMGIGIGIQLSRGISTGGTDLISIMIQRGLSDISLGKTLLFIDGMVVLFAAFVFGNLEVILYSAVTIYVQSKAIDAVQAGLDYAKLIYIITDKSDEILSVLAGEMNRGVTILPAKGGYSRDNKTVLMTAARRRDVGATLRAVKEIDKKAFIILTNATEVHGEGFKES